MTAFHLHIIATRSQDEPQFQASKKWLASRGVFVV